MFRKKLRMEELRIGGENLGIGMDGRRPFMRQGATAGPTKKRRSQHTPAIDPIRRQLNKIHGFRFLFL